MRLKSKRAMGEVRPVREGGRMRGKQGQFCMNNYRRFSVCMSTSLH